MEATIKSMATELAGVFYEQNRSPAFRKAFPTWEAYKGGWQVVGEGQVKKIPPGWMHFVVLARRVLVEMLKQPDEQVSAVMKERIADALIEDHGKAERHGLKVHQRMKLDGPKIGEQTV